MELKSSKDRPNFLAGHDSATGMVIALSEFLQNEKFKGVGSVPTNDLYSTLINNLPINFRKKIYKWSGGFKALSPSELKSKNLEGIDKWIYNLYPHRKYPAIAIGSANGALIHLCAAMGIPWLPQTFLVPVDKPNHLDVDEPTSTMNWAQFLGDNILENNKDWQLHHMMDPNQDRLRANTIGYFRFKKLKLGIWYRRFLEQFLQHNGKIIVFDCNYEWPVHKMGQRHYFQFGGVGGLTPGEYYNGSPKITNFLYKKRSEKKNWEAPLPDEKKPEAEWGFESEILRDLEQWDNIKGIEKIKITFNHPQSVSDSVSEVYKKWYRDEEITPSRLLIDSFNVISPYLTIQKGCIPFWLVFNTTDSFTGLKNYMKEHRYNEVYMMMLSPGKDCIGTINIEQWDSILKEALVKGKFIGTSSKEYPYDLGVYSRYSRELEKALPDITFPGLLNISKGLEWLKNSGDQKLRIEYL